MGREIWYSEKLTSTMISKSFKKAGVTLNVDGSETELFLGYSKEDDVEEMVGEVDQTLHEENKEPVDIEIVKEEVVDPSDEKIFKHIGRIRWWGGRKKGTVEKDFHILKFDKEESELFEDL